MVRIQKASLLALTAALAASCSTHSQRGDFTIVKVVRPTSNGASCIVDPGTLEQLGGFNPFDPAQNRQGYRMGVVVKNNLQGNASTQTNRLDTNQFQIEQARVSYEFPDPTFQVGGLGEFVVPAQGLVADSHELATIVTLVRPQDMAALAGQVGGNIGTMRIHVRLEGRLLDGSSVSTSEYEFSARLCQTCAAVVTTGACTPPQVATACAAGQDSDSFCR